VTERLLGAAGIAHQKKKRESCHSTDEKVQTFFFRFSSDAPSEPTHSISSFFYFFFSMLAPAAAALRRRRRGGTALLV
jgi:hypothetical protein